MSRFLSPTHRTLTPYTPGEQPKDMQYIKLNTNESPYPPSENVAEAAREAAKKLQLYPDPTASELCRAFAARVGVSPDMVLFGNGSDEILQYAFLAFCDSENGAAFADITYGFYKVFAELYHIPYTLFPLCDDLSLDTAPYLGCQKTVFIANPNAPTGRFLPLSEIERLLAESPDRVVVVDEAYIDFGGESAVSLLPRYENLLVVQTFSKSRSMAGARLGMAIGSAALIQDLNTVKYSLNPYNINRMTMAAGLATLAHDEETRQNCKKVIATRAFTEEGLRALGFDFPSSCANFIFARHIEKSGKEIYLRLKERGVLIRHFDTDRLREYNRISIGTKEEMQTLLDKLREILEETT